MVTRPTRRASAFSAGSGASFASRHRSASTSRRPSRTTTRPRRGGCSSGSSSRKPSGGTSRASSSGGRRAVPGAENAELVRRIFDAFARKQGFALRGLFAEDATWVVPGDGVMAGTFQGRDQIFRFLARLPKETGGTYGSRLIDVLASDDRAAALYRAFGEPERADARRRPGAAVPDRGRPRAARPRAPVRSAGVRGVLGAVA